MLLCYWTSETRESGYLSKTASWKSSYNPSSSTVYGILKQLLDNFVSDLAKSRETEKAAIEQFTGINSAKSSEIESMQDSLVKKQETLANTMRINSQSKEDLQELRSSLSSDVAFLRQVHLQCQQLDHEFTWVLLGPN